MQHSFSFIYYFLVSVKDNQTFTANITTEKNTYRNEVIYTVFKKATGNSPVKYLNEYRLSVACELLHNTGDSIKSIAEKVGIPDQFYFSKLFKSKYSVSAQQYRKMKFY